LKVQTGRRENIIKKTREKKEERKKKGVLKVHGR
jgi:hypothetical protein